MQLFGATAAPFPARIHVEGLRELNTAFGRVSKRLQRELQAELRNVAEPLAASVRRVAEEKNWGPRTVSGIRAGSTRGQVVIRQNRRKVTGARSDFGALQMREAFIPEAERWGPIVQRRLEVMLDRLTSENGFGRGGQL